MEPFATKYKLRRFTGRLWYWTRQLTLIALLLGAFLLLWSWQDRNAEKIVSKQGEKVAVLDGDTLAIGTGEQRRTIRIAGIDAPEYRQTCKDARGESWPCGKEVRQTLGAIVNANSLECIVAAQDAYHRSVGSCSVAGISDIGREMVRRGAAVSGADKSDSRYNDGGPYLHEEVEAQRAKRGIWRGTFERPADWREKMKHPANDN